MIAVRQYAFLLLAGVGWLAMTGGRMLRHRAFPLSAALALAEMCRMACDDTYVRVGVQYRWEALWFQPWVARIAPAGWRGPLYTRSRVRARPIGVPAKKVSGVVAGRLSMAGDQE